MKKKIDEKPTQEVAKQEDYMMRAEDFTSAENNLLNIQQIENLFARTPEAHKYKRPAKGGGEWTYVTGVYVKKKLNWLFGWDWDFEVVEHQVHIEIRQAIVLGKLTCRIGGGQIIKMQFGRADIKMKRDGSGPLDLGNDLKAATTDALKKCASELGIAGDVYGANEFKEVRVKEQPQGKGGNILTDDELEELPLRLSLRDTVEELQKLYNSDIRYQRDEEAAKLFAERMIEIHNEQNGQ